MHLHENTPDGIAIKTKLQAAVDAKKKSSVGRLPQKETNGCITVYAGISIAPLENLEIQTFKGFKSPMLTYCCSCYLKNTIRNGSPVMLPESNTAP